MHLELVRSILEKIGLTAADLQCGAHIPFDPATARRLAMEDRPPQTLHNNCSGKHAGLLGLSRFLNAPIEDYLSASHPVQQEILKVVAEFAGLRIEEIAIALDGCSAPVFGLSIGRMALSYARLAAGESAGLAPPLNAAAARVVDAMIEYPEMVGGTEGRLDTPLMRVARGRIISKVGAEGLQLLGVRPEGPNGRYPNGLGIAVKIEDGDSHRARNPVVLETLRQLGLLQEEELAKLSSYSRTKIHNHRGFEVGEVRTCFQIA
jgi:L-asparaginase II